MRRQVSRASCACQDPRQFIDDGAALVAISVRGTDGTVPHILICERALFDHLNRSHIVRLFVASSSPLARSRGILVVSGARAGARCDG